MHLLSVPITGTNYAPRIYQLWCEDGARGHELTLERDPDNEHDRWAVKVLFKGRQMGWIGRTHSDKVAQALDRGLRFDISVIDNVPTRDAMHRLTVYLHERKVAASSEPTIKVFGAPTNGPMLRDKFYKLPVGRVLECSTREGRTSVSILDWHGDDVAWFRKEEPGAELTNEQIMWANRGALVCRIESQNPTTATLHQKGSIKDNSVSEPTDGCIVARDDEGRPTMKIGYFGDSDEPFFSDAHRNFTASEKLAASTPTTTTTKETTMTKFNSFFTNLFATNAKNAANAAYLETGRIANKTVVKLVVGRLPFLARFYAKTPLGSLVVSNAAIMLAQQMRPDDVRLAKLAGAMNTAAYQELIQMIDPESFVDQLLAEPSIKRALDQAEKKFDTPVASPI